MSDSSQGPGWWQASDGKWYPPEQAPGYQAAGAPYGGGGAGGGTDLGTTFSYAWNKFTQNIGEWLILWLIAVGVSILVAVLGFFVAAGASATSGFSGFRFGGVSLLIGTIGGAVQGIIWVALAKAANQATNGQPIDIGAAFKLTSNNIVAGLVFGVIYGLLNSLCGLFGIVAFLLLGFLPVLSAIDDRGADAIGDAAQLSTSRPGEGMVWWLIAWFITGCLCFLGAPVSAIGGVYLAKRFRGEAVAP